MSVHAMAAELIMAEEAEQDVSEQGKNETKQAEDVVQKEQKEQKKKDDA